MFEIGSTLRDARVRSDISLQQAEADTKIRVKYIQAMENEDFDILPAGTYVKGFLRTYAEYLGIDYQLILDEYNDRFGTGEHKEHFLVQADGSPVAKTPKAQKRQTNLLFVAIFAVVIIAVLAYLGWGNTDNENASLVTETSEAAVEEPAQTATAVEEEASETTPVTAPESESNGLQSLNLESTSEKNWVEIRKYTENGETVWSGTLQPGQDQEFTSEELNLDQDKLLMKVGSPIGLVVKINGKEQTVDDTGWFEITSKGITPLE